MNYTLFAKRNISSLNWLLKESGFKSKLSNECSISVEVKNDYIDNFVEDLALYVSTIYYKDNYKKCLSRKISIIEDRLIDKIALLDVRNNENKIYMIQNLKILLKEYLKNNDVLCLESFLIFNATGFTKDISFLAQMYCDSYEDDFSNSFYAKERYDMLSTENDESNSEEISLIISTEDILEFEHIVKKTRDSIDLPEDISTLKRIDLLESNGKITILADEINKLDLNILKTLLCIEDDNKNVDEVTIIYILVGIIALFNIEQIVIHRNIEKNIFEY
ncbi:MAG: hypothetical protein IJH34_05255, partial [Romboutsia sp.]|nr:hypothetical protein [Romboutsia sp.]